MSGLFDDKKYNSEQYQFEKVIGKRTRTGELKLKRLKGIHRQMIAYHLRGMSGRDIAFVTGFDEVAISRILRDPLSAAYINAVLESSDMELSALAPMAVDAVRSGLESDNEGTRLKAADKFFRATGKYNKTDTAAETAEDVIARALAQVAATQAGILRDLTRPDPISNLVDVTPERTMIENAAPERGIGTTVPERKTPNGSDS